MQRAGLLKDGTAGAAHVDPRGIIGEQMKLRQIIKHAKGSGSAAAPRRRSAPKAAKPKSRKAAARRQRRELESFAPDPQPSSTSTSATESEPETGLRPTKPASVTRPSTVAKALSPAVRSASALTRTQQEAVDQFFDAIPRPEIASVLQRTTGADLREQGKLDKMIGLLHDPVHADLEWPALCRNAGLAPHELMAMVVRAYVASGELKLARRIPDVMSGIADAAIDRLVTCYVCDGHKMVEVEDDEGGVKLEKCGNCRGHGEVIVKGDTASRRLALEAMGMLGKGPAIAQQFNFPGRQGDGPAPGGGSGGEDGAPNMSDWCADTDSVFEERRRDDATATAPAPPQPPPEFTEADVVGG